MRVSILDSYEAIYMNAKIIAAMLLLLPLGLMGQEAEGALSPAEIESLDFYLQEEDYSGLEFFLMDLNPEEYQEAEGILLEKVRTLILRGQEELAIKITEVILFINLESNEAQELYLGLQAAIEEKERIAELQKQQESGVVVDPLDVNNPNGSNQEGTDTTEEPPRRTVFVPLSLDYLAFGAEVGFNHLLANSDYANFSGGKGGVPLQLYLYFNHPQLLSTIQLSFFPSFLSYGGENSSQWLGKGAWNIAYLELLPVSLRLGYLYLMNTSAGELAETALYNNLTSPTLGIGLDRFDLPGDLELTTAFDFYFAGFASEFLDAGMDLSVYLAYPFLDLGGIEGAAFLQTYAMFLLAQDASESNINITLGMRFNFNEN
jgi:hypothetical protein